MKRLFPLFILFLLLASIPEVFAGVGIGMGPTRFTLSTSIGKPYSVTGIFYNPGDYDVIAKIEFQCENCDYEASFLGWHIGRVREEYRQFFRFDPEEVYLSNNTGPDSATPVTIHITPSMLVRKDLVITTSEDINFLIRGINPNYKGEFSIPYYTLLIGDKFIKGSVTASAVWSTFGSMGAVPAVGASLELSIKGMPLGSLIIILLLVLIVIVLTVWRVGPKRISNAFAGLRRKKSQQPSAS